MLTGLIATACAEKAATTPEAVVRIAERTLTVEEARSHIPQSMLRADSAAAMRDFAEQWERKALLRFEAERLGLDRDPALQKQLEAMKDEILSQAMNRHLYAQLDTVQVTEAEVDQFLIDNPAVLRTPEASASVALFTFGSLGAAEASFRLANAKATQDSAFATYASEHPDWLGDAGPPQAVSVLARRNPSLASFFASSPAGSVSDIRQSGESWHFFVITQRHSAGSSLPPERLKPSISQWMLEQKKNRRLRSLQQSLILRAENDRILTRYE